MSQFSSRIDKMAAARPGIGPFLGSVFLATLCTAALITTLPWLMLNHTGRADLAGLLAVVLVLPGLLTQPLTGALIDRFGARLVAVVSDVVTAVLCLVAALAWAVDLQAGSANAAPALIVIAAVFSLARYAGSTARKALVPQVAVAAQLTVDSLSGRREAFYAGALLVAPLPTGFALGHEATGLLFGVVGLLSVISALAVSRIEVTNQRARAQTATQTEHSWKRAFAEWRKPSLIAATVAAGWVVSVIAVFQQILLPTLFQETAHAVFLGATLASYALGSIVSAVLYERAIITFRLVTVITVSALVTTACLVAFALLGGAALIALGLVLGLALGITNPLWSAIAVAVPDGQVRGRFLAAQTVVLGGCVALSAGLGGPAVEYFGVHVTVVVMAGITVAVGAIVLMLMKRAAIEPGSFRLGGTTAEDQAAQRA